MNSNGFIRNLDVVKNSASEPFYFYVISDLKKNSSTILARKGSSAASTALYTSGNNIIQDIYRVTGTYTSENILSSVVWCERKGISSYTELCYAEFDEDLNVVRKTVLDSITANYEYVLVRASVVDNMLLISWVDGLGQIVKLRLYDSETLQPISAELELEEYLSLNYFNYSRNYAANLTLTPAGDKMFFLQFLLESGSVCTYKIAITGNTLHATHLFEQGGENVGYHETLLDEDNKQLLTVYSENKITTPGGINDIYIISQALFTDAARKNVAGTPQRVNQSTGFYLRPAFMKYNDQYIILWEGDQLHYTFLNSELNVTTPENIINVTYPAHISMLEQDAVLFSVQQDNWRTVDYGESLFADELPV